MNAVVDLSNCINKHLDFNRPSSITGLTTVDYDGNKTVYVFTEGGYGDSEVLTYPREGETEYRVGVLFSKD